MWSRLSLRSSFNTVLRRNIARSRPTRGGAGHDHHDLHHYHGNKKLGPYEVPHHPAYPQEAHPFGIDFSKGYKAEGWELTTALVYSIMFGMFVYHTYDEKRDDDFGQWAKREAEARLNILEEGGEVQFGKYYSQDGAHQAAYEHSDDDGETPKVAE
eukprot:gene16417-11736_t